MRVSTADEAEGFSLQAQERAFVDACGDRGWRPVHVFRDEGVSAHTDQIPKRPGLKALLEAAGRHEFDIVVVHSLDRAARNLGVMLEVLRQLGSAGVALVSLTEHVDYTTAESRLFLHMLGAFAEYFSDSLSKHVSKGARERFDQGLHNGPVPFGYSACPDGCDRRSCGGLHVIADEAEALLDVARRYAAGAVTYGQAAGELNEKGFRTRQGRRFTTASVRFLLANPILAGFLTYKRGRELQEGKHQAIIPRELFEQLQDARLRRERRPTAVGRSYLLKGIAACVHCGGVLWSEWVSGRGYYREQHGTRQHEGCPASGRSVPCDVIDAQVGELFGRLHLPENWREAIERRVVSHDRRASIELERRRLREHLRRITNAYIDGNVSDETYNVRQRAIRDELDRLVVPEVQAAVSAGELLADMRSLWRNATSEERHELLRPMVSHVYVDILQRRVVGIKPRPAFRDLFAQALTGTPDVLLIRPEEAEARLLEEAGLSFGAGGDGGELNSPSREGPA